MKPLRLSEMKATNAYLSATIHTPVDLKSEDPDLVDLPGDAKGAENKEKPHRIKKEEVPDIKLPGKKTSKVKVKDEVGLFLRRWCGCWFAQS